MQIRQSRTGSFRSILMSFVAVALLIAGVYLLAIVGAPMISYTMSRPIEEASLAAPKVGANRIVIPKLGVDIAYGEGVEALDRGAQWRYPAHGNPRNGGNFVIAAHRYSIQPTPQSTIQKSPFYNVDKLSDDDRIVVDFEGVRYAYRVVDKFDVTPDRGDIEARTDQPRLTLYSCELEGPEHGRVVIIGEPVGAA